jgi:hypothetical protein
MCKITTFLLPMLSLHIGKLIRNLRHVARSLHHCDGQSSVAYRRTMIFVPHKHVTSSGWPVNGVFHTCFWLAAPFWYLPSRRRSRACAACDMRLVRYVCHGQQDRARPSSATRKCQLQTVDISSALTTVSQILLQTVCIALNIATNRLNSATSTA